MRNYPISKLPSLLSTLNVHGEYCRESVQKPGYGTGGWLPELGGAVS